MAQPVTLPFKSFLLLVEQVADSGTFAAPCGMTSRGFNQSASMQETTVPDCADEEAPAYVERDVDSISAEISGSGVLALEDFDLWQAWFDAGVSKRVRIKLDTTLANNGGYYQGSFHLSQFNMSGERGQKTRAEITLVSDGKYTWVPAAA